MGGALRQEEEEEEEEGAPPPPPQVPAPPPIPLRIACLPSHDPARSQKKVKRKKAQPNELHQGADSLNIGFGRDDDDEEEVYETPPAPPENEARSSITLSLSFSPFPLSQHSLISLLLLYCGVPPQPAVCLRDRKSPWSTMW